VDAADVSWEFETALSDANSQALVFVLGDTTFAPCCIDAVAAQHLQADCVVHYGHACLSPCRDIPVFYSFGRQELSSTACVEAVVQEIATVNQQKEAEKEGTGDSVPVQRVLVLYQVCYHHHMEELETLLKEQGSFEQVLMGKIPSPEKRAAAVPGATSGCGKPDCCSNEEKSVPAAEATDETSDAVTTAP
jgi:diphthamide biosynthesis protein 2